MSDEQPEKPKQKNGQESDRPRCGAKARSAGGRPCRKFPVRGAERCRNHGGATLGTRRKIARDKAERALRKTMEQLDIVPVTDPLTALAELAGEIVAWKDTLAVHVGNLREYGYAGEHGEQIKAEVQLYERAMDRAVTVLDKIARLDIDSRLAAIGERQAELVEQALAAALRALNLPMDDEQRAWQALSDHLRGLPQAS